MMGSMYWNPAGIGFNGLRRFINHSNWIADIAFDYFSIWPDIKQSIPWYQYNLGNNG